MQNNGFYTNKTLNVQGRLVDLTTPRIMGILNVTPDSFFDGGKHQDEKNILSHTEKMLSEGADMIDVGGYSSRPGAVDIPVSEELSRVIPVIKNIAWQFPSAVISIDTFRPEVAERAVGEGAGIVNDISGGEPDEKMFHTVAKLKVPYIMMHMRGNPRNMASLTQYDDVVKEVLDYFEKKVFKLHQLGVKDIVVDPGFGFAKTPEQSFTLLQNLNLFSMLGQPILAGLSRKSMIWKTLGSNPENALNGSTVLNTVALMKGASILRVHDVKEAAECVRLLGSPGLRQPV